MNDHELRELVNTVTNLAHQYRDTQQLRERIAGVLVPAIKELRERAGPPLPAGCIGLRVDTRHPQDYVLCNQQDGTRWRGDLRGHWVPVKPTEDVDCSLPFNRSALRGYSESQVKYIRLGWNMHERAMQAMRQGECPVGLRRMFSDDVTGD